MGLWAKVSRTLLLAFYHAMGLGTTSELLLSAVRNLFETHGLLLVILKSTIQCTSFNLSSKGLLTRMAFWHDGPEEH
jgi:hypothetical protein